MMIEAPDQTPNQSPEEPEQVITNLAACANCGRKSILFSRTIQTFCFNCGLPVTELEEAGLYYAVIAANPDPA